MMKNINNFRENMKSINDLRKVMDGIDMSNPEKMLDSMGIDMNELNESFMKMHDKKIDLKYVFKSDNKTPNYEHPTDSGFDLRANEDVELMPFGRLLVPTGLFVDIPEGYEIQVRPKSGLALKKGLTVLNTPGTVDQGYTGEIKVILCNMSNDFQTIKKGDKIAQAVLTPVVAGGFVELVNTDSIQDKDRGNNGFGSTGN